MLLTLNLTIIINKTCWKNIPEALILKSNCVLHFLYPFSVTNLQYFRKGQKPTQKARYSTGEEQVWLPSPETLKLH